MKKKKNSLEYKLMKEFLSKTAAFFLYMCLEHYLGKTKHGSVLGTIEAIVDKIIGRNK